MYKNRIYRQIAADCTKAYWSSILFYALQLIVSQVAVAYSARMLGVFSAYILNNEIQKGLGLPLADFNLRGDFRNAAACMLDDGRAADVSGVLKP